MQRILLGILCVFSVGCHASLKTQAAAQPGEARRSESLDFNKPLALSSEEQAEAAAALESLDSAPPLLGARRDLSLVAGADGSTVQCSCLSVGLGLADMPGFRWEGIPPQLDATYQLAIALSPNTNHCQVTSKNSKNAPQGASYWGYRQQGKDVVVYVEFAREGVPKAEGAIIPKPYEDGQVYVAPSGPSVPFGRATEGAAKRCRIGNPGLPRPAPAQGAEPTAANTDRGP